jgi:tetratricopeptide (TPR) repeat protein
MLLAKLFFDGLYDTHKKSGCVSFQELEIWIGTESNKGSLWNLKDNAHLLFRNDISQLFFYERVFDWTLGSIFHESMKLKEDIYLLEVYQKEGKVFTEDANIPEDVDTQELVEEYRMMISRAQESANEEIDNVEYLFARAMEQLQKLIVRFKEDGLLVRFLAENESLYEKIYGQGSFKELCDTMYDRGLEDAYLQAGRNYREGGWYEEALTILKKALALNPDNEDLRNESEQIQQIMETLA